jgi:hypothetical protein
MGTVIPVLALGGACWFMLAGAAQASPWMGAMQQPGQISHTDVQVATDTLSYVAGQPLIIAVRNGLSAPIYLLGGQTYCSMVGVQRLEGDQWQPVGQCPPGEPLTYLPIAAGGEHTITVDPRTRTARVNGPTVSAPVTPGETTQDVRTLPTSAPTVGPPREIPEGVSPPSPTASPENTLSQGRYRIEVRYTSGAPGNDWQVAYTPPFIIVRGPE